MIDRSAVDRVLAANRYLVLGTVDADGLPWVTPVFFAPMEDKRLSAEDLQPHGPLVVYRAELRRRYVLVRGGNAEFGNAVDMRVEV